MMMILKVCVFYFFFFRITLFNICFLILLAVNDGIYIRTPGDSIRYIAGTDKHTFFAGTFSSVYVFFFLLFDYCLCSYSLFYFI